ncbi:MAG: hypothetical protein [Caudoviricetes sp.]|nr:MAG: hypothetical protein [Caudoviricetes sp.]
MKIDIGNFIMKILNFPKTLQELSNKRIITTSVKTDEQEEKEKMKPKKKVYNGIPSTTRYTKSSNTRSGSKSYKDDYMQSSTDNIQTITNNIDTISNNIDTSSNSFSSDTGSNFDF